MAYYLQKPRSWMQRSQQIGRVKDALVRLHQREKGRCYLCGGEMVIYRGHTNTVTRDHVVPLSRLKEIPPAKPNVRGACTACNGFKANLTEREFRFLLPYLVFKRKVVPPRLMALISTFEEKDVPPQLQVRAIEGDRRVHALVSAKLGFDLPGDVANMERKGFEDTI